MAGRMTFWLATGDMVAGVIVTFYAWLEGPGWLTLIGAALVLGGAVMILLTRSLRA